MSSNPEQDPIVPPAGEAGGAPEAPPGTPERLAADLAAAEARLEEHRNSLLRALAETDNVRKRAQREVEAAHKFGVERFAADLLEARD
ncbi:MAG TPA: nucleotide exchange factor GrpE, partial [Steroidobacteraceae bacterium]|nr:nucleotide exchange factor GrpE [Steroidobacteraceae bacterium]